MTPQENQALQTLLGQLTQVRGLEKDPQAAQMIAGAVAQQPDAAYLLVQRAMILEQALEAAKAQIGELQRQAQQAPAGAAGRGFLDVNAWGNTGGAPAAAAVSAAEPERSVTGKPLAPYASARAPQAGQGPQQNAFPQAHAGRPASPGFLGGGAGSMLGTMAATAAGVAGGAFLFQGIGSLLGNRNEAGGADSQAKNEAAPAEPPQEAAAPQADSAANDQPSLDNASFDDSGGSGFDEGSFDI